VAESAAGAVAASPVVVVCVSDYAASHALLEGVDLGGKALVQLSTGSPSEARAAAAWAAARGADYLDGAIFAVPSQIGTPDSTIFVSGSEGAYRASRELLTTTVGTLTYLGETVGAAAAFDLGILSSLFGALLGFYHGARVVESEHIGVDELGAALASVAPAIGQMIRHDADTIVSGNYADPEASIETCWQAMQLLARQAREAGLDGTFPAFAAARFDAARSAGLASESPPR
jgi:3-hydroxyisobutyrate dehydrogenase-like beta-hydroxyacid dehydrogenase